MEREAPRDGQPVTPTEAEGETLDLPEGLRSFTPGQVLGDRYQIREMLGRGGMGDVWRAFDLKLRVEVALKALREDLFKDEKRLDLLRREVRAAREVVSPNVCRIFDLIEVDGSELVSMEYVDGGTLLAVLQERGPLELKEAQDIASQFLAGLEAIHRAGLVHRDVKPENIMLTRAGRVVVMDFGLTRQEAEGGGSVSGTPAYMAPEQAAGLKVDTRADVYAAGVVLAEMVSPGGIKDLVSRQSVWEGVRQEPANVPDTPWAPVLKKAVAKEPDRRYNSAHTLTRALEDVTLRVEGAEDLNPYPGLASFTESDAEYFFGREAEVEQMWRRLDRPHLLAVVGPSGAGKTSFLRAGLIPSAGPGWGILRCTPGSASFTALGQALAREMAGDVEAMELLARGHEPDALVGVVARWRQRHDHALLVVDQFEELFTHGPADEQRRFTELLARLALEADAFVLLSMRDDFLIRCREHEALGPVFTDLTALVAPTGAALRRAVVQPAMKCGYRFEDDRLVEETLAGVEGERGALPLLAFALARLWEKRDRENGLLTRQVFDDIGGVAGALAKHAEATIDRIGADRVATVRELFRNLVTAEGTRAVRQWDELLSVFEEPKRQSAEEVLRELIDARLLTSYEVRDEDREPTRRVEIIHESLLANWPRLVRWQTQDADAAQLRDQLRQAARTWDEHDRSDDLLWTSSAYREFAVWRERYPGGLSDTEEAFATAMKSFATRRRRRRRIAAAAGVTVLLAVLAVVTLLWQRSVLETRRAEASKLVALAQVQLETDPTEALAYATASLQVADTSAARSMVMRSLWEAPPALVLELADHQIPRFSPEGRRVAFGGYTRVAEVWSDAGDGPIVLRGLDPPAPSMNATWWASESLLVTGVQFGERVRVWSIPAGHLVRTIEAGAFSIWGVRAHRLHATTFPRRAFEGEVLLRSWWLPDGEPDDLGRVDWDALGGPRTYILDRSGDVWYYTTGRSIYARPLPVVAGDHDRVVGTHDADGVRLVFKASKGDRLVSIDREGEIRVWSSSKAADVPVRVIPRPEGATAPYQLVPDPTGRWVYRGQASQVGKGLLWDLSALPGAQPLELRRTGSWQFSNFDFHPAGDWLLASTKGGDQATFWPLRKAYPSVVEGASDSRKELAFSPDARWLAAIWPYSRARLFPLPNADRTVLPKLAGHSLRSYPVFDAATTRLAGGHFGDRLSVVPLNGNAPLRLEGFQPETFIESVAFSPSGRRVAAASGISYDEKTLRVWDLDTGKVRAFELPRTDATVTGFSGNLDTVQKLWFSDENTLVTVGATHFLRWNLEDGSHEEVVAVDAVQGRFAAASAGVRKVLIIEVESGEEEMCDIAELHDLAAGTVEELPLFGGCVRAIALDPGGTVAVTGDEDGIIRVGRIAGGEPHLLAGHEGAIEYVAVSPDLQWVASVGSDSTLRLWPMPDLSKPPLHTLPHDEIIAKLHSLTNLRVVRDEESATGWKVVVGPFPGWETVPTW